MPAWSPAGHVEAGMLHGQPIPAGELFIEIAQVSDVESCWKCRQLGGSSAQRFLIHLERHHILRATIKPEDDDGDPSSAATTTD